MPGAIGRMAGAVAPVIAVVPPPGIAPDCATCRGQGYLIVKAGEQARAQRCSCVPMMCPACDNVGWVPNDPSNPRSPRRPCDCRSLGARMARFDDAKIPGRHAKTLGGWVATSPDQVATRMHLDTLVQEWTPNGENRGVMFHGPVGRGKTHLLCGLLRELVFTRGVTARFVEFSHLLADLKQGFSSGEGSGPLITELAEVDVLGIDELGKGHGTDFEGTVIDEIISRRYNAERTILATTNFPPGDAIGVKVGNLALGERHQPRLADRVGDRVYSRLVETCAFVLVTGEDHRRKNEKQGRTA